MAKNVCGGHDELPKNEMRAVNARRVKTGMKELNFN